MGKFVDLLSKSARANGLWAVVVLGLAWVQPAFAQTAGKTPNTMATGKANCLVRVIHATQTGQGLDPSLEALRPQLTRPPLSAWANFALLKQHELSIAPGTSQPFSLPGDGDHAGTLTFEGRPQGAGKPRLRLRLEISDGKAKLLSTKFVINSGGTVLQAGLKHEKGLLVLGITCTAAE